MRLIHRAKSTSATSSLFLLGSLLLSLAGCGVGGGGGGTPPPPPPPASTLARFAFVANAGDDTLSIFIADNTTGLLRHHGYVPTGSGPSDAVIDPSGQFAYTLNGTSMDISLFQIDSLAGTLSEANCDTVNPTCGTGGTPVSMVFGASGSFAYVANQVADTLTVHRKDPGTGALSDFNSVQPPVDESAAGSSHPVALRLHPNGNTLYAVHDTTSDVTAYTVDPTDGTLSPVTGSPVASGGTGSIDLAITPNGSYAYVANATSGDIDLFTVDATGLLVPNAVTASVPATGLVPQAMAIDPTGQWLYLISRQASGSVALYSIQSDGTLSQINCGASLTCAAGNLPESIAVDPTGQFVSVTNSGDNSISLFVIDQASGKLSALRGLTARNAPASVVYYSDTSEVNITPRFAYVAHEFSNSLTGFSINPSTGALSLIGSTTPGLTPNFVTVDPTGKYVYATTSGDDSISAYSINPSSGALTLIGGSSTAVGQSDPIAIAIDPSGRFLYLANTGSDSISTYGINASSGALTQIGMPVTITAGANPTSVAIDPTGRYLYVANSNTIFDDIWSYRIDPTDGSLTLNQSSVSGTNMDGPASIAIDPSGRFLYTANNRQVLGSCWVSGFAIDPNTGSISELAGSPFSTQTATSFNCNPTSIVADPLGEFLYAASTADRVIVYTMDTSSGALTLSSNALTSNDPYSLAIDASGSYLYSANFLGQDISSFSISSADGSLTEIGTATVTGGDHPISITTTSSFQ